MLVLPQSSVAIHVLVIEDSCGHPAPNVTSLNVTATTGSQLSVAVAVPVAGGSVLWPQAIVILGGHVIAGPRLSIRTIIWVHELELPQPSCAVQVLVMVLPWGQPPPAVTSLNPMIGADEQLSVAVAVPVLAGAVLSEHAIVIFGGQVITGGTLSSTTII